MHDNPERVTPLANPFRVDRILIFRSPGLGLANAFGVFIRGVTILTTAGPKVKTKECGCAMIGPLS